MENKQFTLANKLSSTIVNNYINNNVNGWCPNLDLILFDYFLFNLNNSDGNFCEIGNYEGKIVTKLSQYCNDLTNILCIDINEAYKDIITKNVLNIFPTFNTSKLIFDFGGSLDFDVTNDKNIKFVNSVKLMHIDGEHTGKAVYNDLTIASKLLTENGIVIMDDFNYNIYHDIVNGFYAFNHDNNNLFKLLIISDQKAYVCKASHHEKYMELLNNGLLDYLKIMTNKYFLLLKPQKPVNGEYFIINEYYKMESDYHSDFAYLYKHVVTG